MFSNFGNSASRESTISDSVFKVIIIGDHDVGKSSILTRYLEDSFKDEKVRTYGVDFKKKDLIVQGSKMTFNIWDTAGHEDYRMITANFLRGSAGILLVFDLSKSNFFESLRTWMEIIKEYSDENSIIFLIGNKQDLLEKEEDGKRHQEEIERFMIGSDIEAFYRVSAKENIKVTESFEHLAEEIYKEFKEKTRFGAPVASVLSRKSYEESGANRDKKKKRCC